MGIGAVLVTYNRLEKLKIAIQHFEQQSLLPDYLIIVNNHSTDGTSKFLEGWKLQDTGLKKIVIETKENLGGSGGFYVGLQEALKYNSEWIWVSDDDAYPDLEVFKGANNFIEENFNENLVAICTTVLNNNKIDLKHRRKLKKGIFTAKVEFISEEEYKKDIFELNEFSYVGSIMNKKFLIKYGLTRKEFFIYYDDSEHSYRLSKYGKILCIPKLIVHHDTNDENDEYNWKTYYAIRNKLLYFKTIRKKYYIFEYCKFKCKLIIKQILRYKTFSHKLIKDALKDAKNNKTGISDIYMPGYKIK